MMEFKPGDALSRVLDAVAHMVIAKARQDAQVSGSLGLV